jgi:hypothetical protein
MARVNLCPNPALKNDATGYFGGGTRVTGVTSMLRTTGYQNANNESTLPRGTVTAGLTYRFSAYIKGTGGASSGNANINWYSGGAYLASSPGQGWSVTTGTVTRVESGAQVAPAGADQGLLNITGVDAQVQITAVLYEQTSSILAFFDGDDANCAWNGTNGNSTSTKSDESPPDEGGGGGGGGGGGTSDEAAITQGWGTPIWQSEFTNPAELNSGIWGLYNGPGHAGNGLRRPSAISYTGGLLRISGDAGGTTGGMAHQVSQQYGRWEARMRAYSTGGTGQQYHPVLIIWPDSEDWPDDGEYDFLESNVGETAGAYIHYPHPVNGNTLQQEHATDSSVQLSDWHNYAIDWQSTGITGYIDGRQWYHYANGAGPAGRRNIQSMPSGSMRIQLDNFGGSPHKPANMDIEWMKVYDDQSFSSNTGITAGGIPSAESFGVPLIGNRFRLYMSNAAAGVTTTPSTYWDQTTGAVTGKALGLNRSGANTSVTVTETSTNNKFDFLAGQWISPPFTSSGTVQGAFQFVTAISESNAAADLLQSMAIRVVSNDGTVVRGEIATLISINEISTTPTANLTYTDGSFNTPVPVQLGDRLVFEYGARGTNTVTTSYTFTARYGGTAGDLETGDTANVNSFSPWIQFSDPGFKALFYGQTVTPTGIASAEAFGTAVLVQPPTRALTGVGGIASAEAVPSPVVHAEAYIISPSGFGGEVFGVASVSNSIVDTGIPSGEAFGSHRVRRLSDLFPDSIASAEAFGALVLVHYQEIAPPSIESAEAFGFTQVEDPHRVVAPFSILSAEAFGIPNLSARFRSTSILSAEAFGKPRVRRAFYRLVQPERVERWRLGDPGNVIYVRNVVGLTVYGDDSGLFTAENPKTETLFSAKYVWQGGHDNITEDQAIRDLWVANGYQVEMSY